MYLEFPVNGVVLALDPAKQTGFGFGRPSDTPKLETVNFARDLDTAIETFGRAAAWFAATLKAVKPNLVVIEAVIAPMELPGRTQYATTVITHGLFAIFSGNAKAAKIPVIEAPIKTWRKYFLGSGNLKGDDAKRGCVRLCRQLSWAAPDHNAAEAAGIWAWGCAQVEPQRVRRIEPLFVTGSPQ